MKSAIITVHRFICQLLSYVFEDAQVRTKLPDLINKRILKAYKRAWDQKDFLVRMELRCQSLQTYNSPQFDAAIRKIGQNNFRTNLVESFNKQKFRLGPDRAFNAVVEKAASDFSSGEVVQDIHDLLCAYYTIATERFIDNICRQAVTYFLLEADDGPVKLLTPEFIANLSDSQLERIAGEDAKTKAARLSLYEKTKRLKDALKAFRKEEVKSVDG